jgi:hypothetical protein
MNNYKLMNSMQLLNTFVTYFNRTYRKKDNLFSDVGDTQYSTNYQTEILYKELLKNNKNPKEAELLDDHDVKGKFVLTLKDNTQYICLHLVPLLLLIYKTYGDDLYNIDWVIDQN